MPKKEAIAEVLLAKGLISQEQLNKAREEMAKTGLSFENALEKLGYLTKADIIGIMAESMGVPYVDIKDYLIDPDIVKLIPEQLAKKFKVIPLFMIGDTLTVAMVNPRDVIVLDEIRMKSKISVIEPVMTTENGIEKAIEQYYGVAGSLDDVVKTIDKTKFTVAADDDKASGTLARISEEAPIIKLVNLMLTQAIKDKASDIHVEPEESFVRVRFRVDGILREVSTIPKSLQGVVLSRIKIMSKIDIAETRKPQDGRISLRAQNKSLDLRVSTFPTIHGENIVMRLLDKSSVIFGLPDLGFSDKDLKEFQKMIVHPYGIVLVTGPTGSGKTTTLYSALSTINSMEKNIITVEDPVEYELPLIRQTQVNPKAGLTFATGLRAILRQDPNVVMVGEIRDKETADIAIQASLTGHLVFSTLHTNDAPSALTRLIDMGVEPFLIASSVIAILAQRLVRVICKDCKQSYAPPAELLKELGIKESVKFYKGKGCETCKGSGYTGRLGIYELLHMSDDIRKLVTAKTSADDISKKAVQEGMRTLRDDGLDKARRGITTIEEILRVTEEG